MKILFAGGGTAGHINPALAIAKDISEKNENTEISFVGTAGGLEVSLIPHSGYTLDLIKIHGFDRSSTFAKIKTLTEIPMAVVSSMKIIKKFKPDIVIGTGGYVCGPVLFAAAKMGIPTFVHESNAFPGITTKILAKYIDKVAIGIDAAKKHLGDCKNVVHTGTPIRPSILSVNKKEAREKLGLNDKPFILIFGGSLGARDFNKAFADWICKVKDEGKYQILMGTGKSNQYESVKARLDENGYIPEKYKDIKVSEYIYDMDIAMNAADLVISRAGASTLAELTAIGKPAILVPSPYVTDNHQEHNARAIESGGGAKVLLEKDLSVETIDKLVRETVESPDLLEKMREGSLKMGVPDSADIIYKEIMSLL